MKIQHVTEVATRQGRVIRRRDFLRQLGVAGLAAGTMSWTDAIAASAERAAFQGHGVHPAVDAGRAVAVRNVQPQARPRQRRRDQGDRHERFRHSDRREPAALCEGDGRPGRHPLDDQQGRQSPAGDLPAASRLPADGRREVPDARLERGPADRRRGESTAQLRADRRPAAQFRWRRVPGRRLRSARAAIGRPAAGEHDAAHRRRLATNAGCDLLDSLQGHFASARWRADCRRSSQAGRAGSRHDHEPADGSVRHRARTAAKLREAYGAGRIRRRVPDGPPAGRAGVTFVEVVSEGWDTHVR